MPLFTNLAVFFNIIQNTFACPPLSNIRKKIVGLYEDICEAITNSAVLFEHGFDPFPPFVKKTAKVVKRGIRKLVLLLPDR